MSASSSSWAAAVHTVTIRVYDVSAIRAADRSAALSTATALLSVLIDARWLLCPPRTSNHMAGPCEEVLAPHELAVRLVRDRHRTGDQALGFSLLDADTGDGVLATVFVNRVEQLVTRSRTDRNVLLGRAIAHEIGHLVLGTTTHTVSGLMRMSWTVSELERDRPDDWTFSQETLAQISVMRSVPRCGYNADALRTGELPPLQALERCPGAYESAPPQAGTTWLPE